MKYRNAATAVVFASLLSACSSPTDNNDRMPDKTSSSAALQIVSAAGAGDLFRDRAVPKEALRNVSATGYVGQTLLGVMFTTGIQGFLTAFISDEKFMWDDINYITFVDAEQFQDIDSEQLGQYLITKHSPLHPPITAEYANSVSKMKVTQSQLESKTISNMAVKGFNVEERSNSDACYDFFSNRCYIGHVVQIRGRSLPIDANLFDEEIRQQLPSEKVMAIRYSYSNSHEVYARLSPPNSYFTDYSLYPSSPSWRLPEHTFMSMSETYQVSNFDSLMDNKIIRYVPMVRNNDKAYFFVKPVDGQLVKSELNAYHTRYITQVENGINNQAK